MCITVYFLVFVFLVEELGRDWKILVVAVREELGFMIVGEVRVCNIFLWFFRFGNFIILVIFVF